MTDARRVGTTARAAPAATGRSYLQAAGDAWPGDLCPPAPLVLAGELCLPPAAAPEPVPEGARPVLGDVLVVAPRVTASHRAAALALLLPHRHGVVVRATAAWVWTGAPCLRPCRVDLAVPPSPPGLPGPGPAPRRAGLPVRRTRWTAGTPWSLVAGVAVTTPASTAAECARRLPAPTARRCLEALTRGGLVDLAEVAGLLRPTGHARAPSPPGTAGALTLLASL